MLGHIDYATVYSGACFAPPPLVVAFPETHNPRGVRFVIGTVANSRIACGQRPRVGGFGLRTLDVQTRTALQ